MLLVILLQHVMTGCLYQKRINTAKSNTDQKCKRPGTHTVYTTNALRKCVFLCEYHCHVCVFLTELSKQLEEQNKMSSGMDLVSLTA